MPWHLNKIACSAPPKEPCLIPASTSGNSQPPFPPAAGTLILLGPTGTWASAHRPFPYIHIHKIKIKKKYTELPFFSFLPFLLCFVLFWQLVGTLFSFHLFALCSGVSRGAQVHSVVAPTHLVAAALEAADSSSVTFRVLQTSSGNYRHHPHPLRPV